MKVECELLSHMHLDPGYALLSVQNCFTCMEMFNILDCHRAERLNDVQFLLLMKNTSNLSTHEVELIFNLLDIDHSGEIEFDEFYLIFCILIACKDSYEKEFIYRHSKSIFQLIDTDGSGEISSDEFSHMGILFNFDNQAIKRIFVEFDVSGDRNLDFAEFRLFTMACIDESRAQDARSKVKAFNNYHDRLMAALEPILRRFIRTDMLPVPAEVVGIVQSVRKPYKPALQNWKFILHSYNLQAKLKENRLAIRNWFYDRFGSKPGLYFCCWLSCCGFCCITHTEDQKQLRKCCCKCNCFRCWAHFIEKFCGLCMCCCCSTDDQCCGDHSIEQHAVVTRENKYRRNRNSTPISGKYAKAWRKVRMVNALRTTKSKAKRDRRRTRNFVLRKSEVMSEVDSNTTYDSTATSVANTSIAITLTTEEEEASTINSAKSKRKSEEQKKKKRCLIL